MADTLTTETAKEAEPGKGHNTQLTPQERADLIAQTVRELTGLDEEIKELQQKRRRIVQKKIKAQLGLKVADFNAALRLYRLDDDARSTFFSALRESFAALGFGEQLDFITHGGAS